MNALHGKAVVVTGAGRGIGAACARGVAALGAAVVVNDIDGPEAESTAAAIRSAGGQAVAHVADICSWEAAGDLVQRCVREFGAIDGLVNNAGLFGLGRLDELEQCDEPGWRRMIEVNVIGSVNCAAHAVRHMKSNGGGSIVNVTSGAQMGIPAMSVYGATKGAVASLTYAWAMELKDSAIRVNAVSPLARTRMVQATQAYFTAQGLPKPITTQPEPERVSPIVEFLLSDAAGGITGQVVRIEGTQLALCAHPGVLVPMLVSEQWDFAGVRAAFAADLAGRQQPLGMIGIRGAEILPNPSAAWTAGAGAGE